MAIKVKSTKSFKNLPCAHAQHFDLTPDGKPGACAALHGYDREVILTFAGEIDDNGWIYPFGDLKKVKEFLEFYFDHVSIIGADDPRIDDYESGLVSMVESGLLGTLRVLPYGVSMEMSSLFIWENVNPYIYHSSGGRVYLEKVECKEHERNSAFIEVDEKTAVNQASMYKSTSDFMIKSEYHAFESPKNAIKRLS